MTKSLKDKKRIFVYQHVRFIFVSSLMLIVLLECVFLNLLVEHSTPKQEINFLTVVFAVVFAFAIVIAAVVTRPVAVAFTLVAVAVAVAVAVGVGDFVGAGTGAWVIIISYNYWVLPFGLKLSGSVHGRLCFIRLKQTILGTLLFANVVAGMLLAALFLDVTLPEPVFWAAGILQVLILLRYWAIHYRVKQGLYGSNDFETRALIKFVIQQSKKDDWSDGNGPKKLQKSYRQNEDPLTEGNLEGVPA